MNKPQPQIIDLTIPAAPEKTALKPIELVGCLQDYIFEDKDNSYKFRFNTPEKYLYDSFLNNAKIIKRLTVLGGRAYPVLSGMSLIEVDGIVFLGWWNDGVVS